MRTLSTITRIRIVRVETPDRSSPARRHGWRPLTLAIAVMALVGISAAPALAASTGSGTATINIVPAVYSVTVSPATFSFGLCSTRLGASTGSSLGFPDGYCYYGTGTSTYTTGVTITNTGAAGHIDVNGSNAVPSDAGTPWTLCSEQGGTCTYLSGGLYYPGANQFQLGNLADPDGSNAYTIISNSPACDEAFDASVGCSAASGASQIEGLEMTGPESSTDTSSTFTTTLTWTAGP
jgi:hypothetical protein